MLKNKVNFNFDTPENEKHKLRMLEKASNIALLNARFEYASKGSALYKSIKRLNARNLK